MGYFYFHKFNTFVFYVKNKYHYITLYTLFWIPKLYCHFSIQGKHFKTFILVLIVKNILQYRHLITRRHIRLLSRVLVVIFQLFVYFYHFTESSFVTKFKLLGNIPIKGIAFHPMCNLSLSFHVLIL